MMYHICISIVNNKLIFFGLSRYNTTSIIIISITLSLYAYSDNTASVTILCTVSITGKTGVEMEALTGLNMTHPPSLSTALSLFPSLILITNLYFDI